jgi:folate-binding protein YgfZ
MSAVPQVATAAPPSPAAATPLAAYLAAGKPEMQLLPYRGALTPATLSEYSSELTALTGSAGIYDLGYMAFLRISGNDRVRWLNGMVTNTVQSLEEGHSNYSFLLNAQGRILGDATIYHFSDHLLLGTDRSQIARLAAHLDHFIIMDEVELHELDASTTVLGIAGPQATEILGKLGLTPPDENAFAQVQVAGSVVTLVQVYGPVVPQFGLWVPSASLPSIWSALVVAGAIPCGVNSIEALRVLSAIPLYGVDILERHLVQETAQTRALNFNKGCYLGQEIVERIRSRATIHRTLRQFSLTGNAPAIEPGQTAPLNAEGTERNPVGELTSAARYQLPGFTGTLGLGFIRTEVLERKAPITYSEGTAAPLDAPPTI